MSATKGPIDTIDELNKQVSKLVEKHKGPEIDAVRGGAIVYRHRWLAFVGFAYLTGFCMFLHGIISLHPLTSLIIFAFMWLYCDVYSGVLHIVLDNPLNIELPLVGQGALEFQWHHLIPTDISQKPFLEVCGDLNLPAVASLSVYCYFAPFDPLLHYLAALKIFNAYYGQFSHRMAHTMANKRPEWVKWMQKNGLLLTAADHWLHHTTYNDNFAINSGITNQIINSMSVKIRSRWFWVSLWGVMSFFDVFFFRSVFGMFVSV